MNRERQDLILRLVKLTNVILMLVPIILSWKFYYSSQIVVTYEWNEEVLIGFIYCIVYMVFGRIYEAFNVYLLRISEMIYSQILACFFSDAILYLIICLMTGRLSSLWPIVISLLIQLVLSVLWCLMTHLWYYHTFPAQPTAVIYDLRPGMENLINEYGMDKRFRVVKTVDIRNFQMEQLEGVTAVFLCGIPSHKRNIICKYCINAGITIYTIPRIGDLIMSGAKQMHMFHLPIQRVERYRPVPEYRIIKRLFDVIISGAALLILSPLMIITAIAVKSVDGGPALYRQKRLTKDGQVFELLKFRSMRVDAEKDGVARLSTGDKDERITPVGHVIRKVRLDELPQLINILRGEMSIVGPRPERPEIAAQYEETLPEFRLRLQAKAGLTGYAQVYGKYNTTPYDKLQMDLMYIAHPSLFEDLRIMFATVKILFTPESTEGVGEGQVTAEMAATKEEPVTAEMAVTEAKLMEAEMLTTEVEPITAEMAVTKVRQDG